MTHSSTSWKYLPKRIFDDMMMMTELGSLQDLHKCRHVCQSWNVMISEMTKYKKDQIKSKAESLADQIEKKWNERLYPLLPEIVSAASLAHHGKLRPVSYLDLRDFSLASVPTKHLVALASLVKLEIKFWHVSNCDLTSILDCAKSEWLNFNRQSLSSEETRALVRAMETGVNCVELGEEGEVSLDMTALTQYSGHGKCVSVTCYGDTADRYREEVRTWAQRMNWIEKDGFNHEITITKNDTCGIQ